MNVSTFVDATSNRNDYLTASVVGKKGCKGRILEVKPVKTPKFNGLFLTVKIKGEKYAYPLSFDRFDLGAVAGQLNSPETDDWLGREISFVCKKGTNAKGKTTTFVNVARPKAKGKTRKGR